MQVHVPMRGGIARFVVVSQRFCDFGRMTWGPQKSPHEPFVGIVPFVVVFEQFLARFCVLWWFRTDFSDADVIRIQDLGAGIARFVMVCQKFGASCRTASGPEKSIHDREVSIAANPVTSGSYSIRDREASIADNLVTSASQSIHDREACIAANLATSGSQSICSQEASKIANRITSVS